MCIRDRRGGVAVGRKIVDALDAESGISAEGAMVERKHLAPECGARLRVVDAELPHRVGVEQTPVLGVIFGGGDLDGVFVGVAGAPVSYTHLDVYKRQVLGAGRASNEESGNGTNATTDGLADAAHATPRKR